MNTISSRATMSESEIFSTFRPSGFEDINTGEITDRCHKGFCNRILLSQIQYAILQNGGLAIQSPFSGKSLFSNNCRILGNGSFPNFQIAYEFDDGGEQIVILFGFEWVVLVPLFIYSRDSVLVVSQKLSQERIDALCLSLNSILNQPLKNFCQPDARPNIIIGWGHFAHHLWNEMSGLQRIIDLGLEGKIGKVIVLEQPIAPIADIFPEIADRIVVSSFAEVAKKNGFFIWPGYCFVKRKLAERIINASAINASSEVLDQRLHFRQQCDIILWVTVREDYRTWVSFENGIVSILRDICVSFPLLRFGVLFDGWSCANDRLPTERARASIQRESSLIEKVVKSLSVSTNIKSKNLIGLKFPDVISWSTIADLYFSHSESLQHKIGWIANPPGVVHTNRQVLSSGRTRFAGVWREHGIPQKYLRLQDVTDITEGALSTPNKGRPINNYDFDLRAAQEMLHAEIEAIITAKGF